MYNRIDFELRIGFSIPLSVFDKFLITVPSSPAKYIMEDRFDPKTGKLIGQKKVKIAKAIPSRTYHKIYEHEIDAYNFKNDDFLQNKLNCTCNISWNNDNYYFVDLFLILPPKISYSGLKQYDEPLKELKNIIELLEIDPGEIIIQSSEV